jgi:pimeloyl-ACP methyl ester carboxylesterase
MLAHERTGSGPPLVLLHGLGSCKEMWRPVIPLLAHDHDVIAVDLPGFGESAPGAETVDGMAHELAAFAEQLGLERPHVAGNSMGGGLALALGAQGVAASACAISPIGFANDREAAYARVVLTLTRVLSVAGAPIAGALGSTRALRIVNFSHLVGRAWRLPAGEAALWVRKCAAGPGFWPLLRNAPSWDVEPPLCPTTVAWGDRDRLLIYSRQAPRARRVLPDARHVTLTGCGHVPTWDDPEAVARVILETSSARAARAPRPRASAGA